MRVDLFFVAILVIANYSSSLPLPAFLLPPLRFPRAGFPFLLWVTVQNYPTPIP